eukprot:350265-Chlamydomonas_euryale.AAC.2
MRRSNPPPLHTHTRTQTSKRPLLSRQSSTRTPTNHHTFTAIPTFAASQEAKCVRTCGSALAPRPCHSQDVLNDAAGVSAAQPRCRDNGGKRYRSLRTRQVWRQGGTRNGAIYVGAAIDSPKGRTDKEASSGAQAVPV